MCPFIDVDMNLTNSLKIWLHILSLLLQCIFGMAQLPDQCTLCRHPGHSKEHYIHVVKCRKLILKRQPTFSLKAQIVLKVFVVISIKIIPEILTLSNLHKNFVATLIVPQWQHNPDLDMPSSFIIEETL